MALRCRDHQCHHAVRKCLIIDAHDVPDLRPRDKAVADARERAADAGFRQNRIAENQEDGKQEK